MLYRFPFDLSQFFAKAAAGSSDLFGAKFFFRVDLFGNAQCTGSSETIQLDYSNSALTIESPLRAQYDTDSVIDFVVSATALPNRDISCVLVSDGFFYDSVVAPLVDFVTGSAGSKQLKLVRARLPQTLAYYDAMYILCETVDKRQPTLKFQTDEKKVNFKVERGFGSVNVTSPRSDTRLTAGLSAVVEWTMNPRLMVPASGSLLRLHRTTQTDDAGLPVTLQVWPVQLATLNLSVTIDADTADGPNYYLALVLSPTAIVHSPLFIIDPAVGKPPSAPTPAPPTAAPDETVTAPEGFTVATILTPNPTPFIRPPPPTPFVLRTLTKAGVQTTGTKTAPPGACNMRANGEYVILDKCGVCGGSGVSCSREPADDSLPIIIGASIGGVVLLFLLVVVGVVLWKRRQGRTGRSDDRTVGADIVMAEERRPRANNTYAREDSVF